MKKSDSRIFSCIQLIRYL